MFLLILIMQLFNLPIWAGIPAGYYDAASGKSGSALKSVLHDIVSDHTKYGYTASSTDVWDILKDSDEDPANSNNVILIYTGRSQAKTENSGENFTYTGNRWNREHVWAKSHGFPDEADTAYTDCHHLRPTDETVNSSRGNKDFDNGGTQHSEATECYSDTDSWEPRDAVKGDVARMIFYMVVRYDPGYHSDGSQYDLELVDYTGIDIGDPPGEPLFGKLSTLKAWHAADPVDSFESNRNEVVYGYQGNRNPFIDHPEYVDSLWNDALAAPTNLSSSNVQETTLTLTWADNAPDESGYYLYKGASKISTLPANTTTSNIAGLVSGTTYTFKVSAYNDSEESSQSTVDVTTSGTGNLIISGVYDGPLSGGTPKGVEIYAINSVADLSSYGLGSANNGGGTDGQEFTFPTDAASAGDYIYIASESTEFNNWFGSAPNYTSGAMAINGDDAIELFYNGSVIDVFGDINTDGNGQAWEYLDGWAYSDDNRDPSTTFNTTDWSYSSPNAWDDDASNNNASSSPTFPVGTYSRSDQSLPVELSRWTATSTKAYVELNWTTESEIENLGFIIERRLGEGLGLNIEPTEAWIQIGSYKTNPNLKGHGSTSAQNQYSFTDEQVEVGQTYKYLLADVDYQGILTKHTEIRVTVQAGSQDQHSGEKLLGQAYPNPFNSEATFSFSVPPENSHPIQLYIYDINGVLVETLLNKYVEPGRYTKSWNARNFPSGVYFVKLVRGSSTEVQRLLLLR